MRGVTVSKASREVGVDRTTFYTWLKTDVFFQAELNRAKQERADATRAQIMNLTALATSTVREILGDSNLSAGIRLKAALAILRGAGSFQWEEIGSTDDSVLKDRAMFDLNF